MHVTKQKYISKCPWMLASASCINKSNFETTQYSSLEAWKNMLDGSCNRKHLTLSKNKPLLYKNVSGSQKH